MVMVVNHKEDLKNGRSKVELQTYWTYIIQGGRSGFGHKEVASLANRHNWLSQISDGPVSSQMLNDIWLFLL